MKNRRLFLGSALAATATPALAAATRATAAAPEVVLGGIGCGGQGTNLLKRFAALEGVRIAYVCDPDRSRAEAAARVVEQVSGSSPKVVADLRTVLDDRSVQAVTVATPDHWHAPAAILACDAGKHVYVEKPCCHNIREGELLVEAARRNQRVVQHGTQSRSNAMVKQGIAMLQAGAIGEVLVAKAFNVQRRRDIGKAQPSAPPPGFDYDLWVGPAAFVPYQANRSHYSWHWWYDFGTGDMGNDGVHELDIARWGLGVQSHPSKVAAVGGKYFFDDDQQFPDTQTVAFEYERAGGKLGRRQLVFELRIWSPYQPEGMENGNFFYGTDGYMLLGKGGTLKLFDAKGKPRPVAPERENPSSHHEDFLRAIRNQSTPAAEIAIGFASAALCHYGNIATRVGRTIHLDPVRGTIQGDDEASRLLGRTYRKDHWAVPRGV